MAELERDTLKGRLIPVEDVQEREVAAAQLYKRSLMALVRRLPPKLVGLREQEIAVVIREAFRGVCNRLAGLS